MKLPSIPFVMCLFTASAWGQTVLLFNAFQEQESCLTIRNTPSYSSACSNNPPPLSIGKTLPLLVLNRRFLDTYSVELGDAKNVTSARPLGGDVLTVPFVTAVEPSPRSAAGISRKTMADFLVSLLDVTSSSEPVAELEHERQVVAHELKRVDLDVQAFNRKYFLVVGDNKKVAATCGAGLRQRDGFTVRNCLEAQFNALPNVPPINEQIFLAQIRRVDGLYADVKLFGGQMKAADFPSLVKALDSDIRDVEEDLDTFRANLDAATDAAWVAKKLKTDRSPQFALQIRQQLRKKLTSIDTPDGASQRHLSEIELNVLIDQYFGMLSVEGSIPQVWRDRLDAEVKRCVPTLISEVALENARQPVRDKLDQELPILISSINDWAIRVGTQMNAIYWKSQVNVTETEAALEPVPSNGVVSYRILRSSQFQPYRFSEDLSKAPSSTTEVARGAFGLRDTSPSPKDPERTIWQLLRLIH